MRDVRRSQLFLCVASLAILAWACGGGGSPTAPASFDVTGIFQGEAKCATPPCGGGNAGGGGKKNQDELAWAVSASGSLSAVSQQFTMAPDDSMSFLPFGFTGSNSGFQQLAQVTEYPDFATCFSTTGYTGDALTIESDPKSGELHAVYRFGAQRLDLSRPITYEIVFHGLDFDQNSPRKSWPPVVGTTVLTTAEFEVSGVAQKNNTCNGSGTLPGGPVSFTLVGSTP